MTITTIIESFELKLKTCVREVPGKRMVFSGSWQDNDVFAKLFIHKESAERHWKREVAGLYLFKEAGILSPEILWCGKLPKIESINNSENSYGLIVKAIPNAVSFADEWEKTDDKKRLLNILIPVLASHHNAGLIQTDLHFGNFIISDDLCYSLDGDALHKSTAKISSGKAAENYALLTAQAAVADEEIFLDLIGSYCKTTGYDESTFRATVNKLLHNIRKRRCQKLLNKIYRECTAVNAIKNSGRRAFIHRPYESDELRKCIENPDSFFPKDANKLLKNGNSATVALAKIDGRKVVIKRYNYQKNIKTFIRRFRKSRASISWSNAFRLKNYGLNTPEPIALIETYRGPMMQFAYYISEYVEGTDLEHYCKDPANLAKLQDIKTEMESIFSVFKKCQILHGDCKATNFILSNGQIYIIDLDAMKEYSNSNKFSIKHQKDLKRWLKNWEDTGLFQN